MGAMHAVWQVKTSRTFLRDTTVTSPMALLLSGGSLEVRHEEGYVLLDGWIRVRAAAPSAVLVKKLRAALDAVCTCTMTIFAGIHGGMMNGIHPFDYN